MHAWNQIQQTLDYIEDHLSEEIEIEKLARLAALSPFYFQRLFKRLVKKPVAEYIKLRRMAVATESLLQPDQRILDIALASGFASHEHFSRTFKDTFGLTPEDYRRSPVPLNKMTKPQLLFQYTLVDEGVPLISDGIVLEVRRMRLNAPEFFIGQEAQAPVGLIAGLGVESGPDPLYTLWQTFHDKKDSLPHLLLTGGDEIGVSHPSGQEDAFCYFAGARAHSGAVPAGYQSWTLDAGEYIVCSFEAENFEHLVMDVLYKAQHYLFDTWLPSRGLATEAFCAERYESHGPQTTKMEIWVKPVANG